MAAAVAALAFAALGVLADRAGAETRELKLYNTHTQERATIVFKRDGVFDPEGLRELNRFLRDWREDRVTEMDPRLFDLVWEVYQQTGSDAAIAVVCGYRSPPTNEMLRRRSDGVAENSLHMKGQALDFFIPGVNLATLRAVGLRMQEGGVGFYPTSGSPFVHLDTGSVRHWPRMTHDQLVKVFPDGKTLHIPSDGKPLPGYNEALAAYKARQAGTSIVIASAATPTPQSRPTFLARLLGKDADEVEDEQTAAETTPPPARQPIGVAVASYEAAPVPTPRLAPVRAAAQAPVVIAAAPAPKPLPPVVPAQTPYVVAAAMPLPVAPAARTPARAAPDFSGAWTAPAVPAALTAALARHERRTPGASLPIAPTAVVATVSVGRPRVADITSAVIKDEASGADLPPVLAYANEPAVSVSPRPVLASAGVLLPRLSPFAAPQAPPPASPARAAAASPVRAASAEALPPLTMTALDTQSLKLWMRDGSTRQRGYALMTLPDFAQSAAMMSAPTVTYATGFSVAAPYGALRTDHFAPVAADPAPVIR